MLELKVVIALRVLALFEEWLKLSLLFIVGYVIPFIQDICTHLYQKKQAPAYKKKKKILWSFWLWLRTCSFNFDFLA